VQRVGLSFTTQTRDANEQSSNAWGFHYAYNAHQRRAGALDSSECAEVAGAGSSTVFDGIFHVAAQHCAASPRAQVPYRYRGGVALSS
jgi:hypothetical protein